MRGGGCEVVPSRSVYFCLFLSSSVSVRDGEGGPDSYSQRRRRRRRHRPRFLVAVHFFFLEEGGVVRVRVLGEGSEWVGMGWDGMEW